MNAYTHRAPVHPGEILLEEFLKPLGLTQRELADGIGAPYQRVNELVNGKRGITADTALRLAAFFGTSPRLWMSMQTESDLYAAWQRASRRGTLIPVDLDSLDLGRSREEIVTVLREARQGER